MLDHTDRRPERASAPESLRGMVHIPGGTFRMGSDKRYPEEAPVHRVAVDDFWTDVIPVANRTFRKFIQATGYVTFAEIRPSPRDYPRTADRHIHEPCRISLHCS